MLKHKDYSKWPWLNTLALRLLLAAGLLSLCDADHEVFYVTPTDPETCSHTYTPCHTLDQYARDTSLLAGHTNVSLIFLEGVHNLSSNLSIELGCSFNSTSSMLVLKGQGTLPEDTTINVLSTSDYFTTSFYIFATELHLNNIHITLQSIRQLSSISLCTCATHLKIENCSMESDVSFILSGFYYSPNLAKYNVTSTVSIINTNFKMVVGIIFLQVLRIQSSHFVGLGIIGANDMLLQNVNITNSEFIGLYLISIQKGAIVQSTIESNVIGVVSVHSNIDFNDSVITGNDFGIVVLPLNLALAEFTVDEISVLVVNCTFSCNNVYGLAIINALFDVILSNNTFHNNQGTPITAYQSTFELQGETIFRDNNVARGGAITLVNSTVIFGPESNTMFINNTAEEYGGAIYIFNLPITLFSEALIVLANQGEAFRLLKPNDLYRQSCFYSTKSNSHITFTGNTANLGGEDIFGATVYDEDCLPSNDPKLNFNNRLPSSYKISSNPTRVCFCATNNTPQCKNTNYLILSETRYPGENFTVSVVLAGYNFGRVAGSVYTNVLGRDHTEVIADNEHLQSVGLKECTNLKYTVSSNQLSGSSVVLVLTTHEQSTHERDKEEITKNVRNVHVAQCSGNTFPCTALLTTPVYINITLKACPLGFSLENGTCKCDSHIRMISSSCETQQIGYVSRESTVWVGVDTSENNTDVYYWHKHCPRDYCMESQISIDLMFPDKQCQPNRTGVLCGQCKANYSLRLGGNKCLKCSDDYLFLLMVFAVFGILLVILIKLLNLTVTSGTVNGLIFYANVVWSNNAILFSLRGGQGIDYYIAIPIAWMNLDFGIETCFSKNLDQLTKTGLQFVFPVYIWCIAGAIITICHYSTRATKLFGNNSVAVLATLFLLSYGKLLRSSMDAFAITDINIAYSNGTVRKVWSLDGNVLYGETPGHIVLMVVALIFLVLFLLPFTLTLLLVPFLKAKSHLRPLRWINTLKPFFDTYYGPFKDKKQHQVWTGILLISRVLTLTVIATSSTIRPNANLLLMIILASSLLFYSAFVGLLYKKSGVSISEMLYLFNLIILGGASLFSRASNSIQSEQQKSQLIITAVSVSIALVQFCCILVFHLVKQITSIEKIQTYLEQKEIKRKEKDIEVDEPIPQAREQGMGPTVQVVELRKNEYESDPSLLRETLLETSS